MRSFGMAVFAALCITLAFSWAPPPAAGDSPPDVITLIEPDVVPPAERPARPSTEAVRDGIAWLASVQGHDGGWGQDGGETSYVRQGEHLENTGNDLANSAVATLALLHAGNSPTQGRYAPQVRSGVEFILRAVEQSEPQGLALKTIQGTQIQRKLGPYIDTFLTSKLLGELDGESGDPQLDARVRQALDRCILKIQSNQAKDGSWNFSGGWAPILGTSLASQSLDIAQRKGLDVDQEALARIDSYTATAALGGAAPAAAGVDLYRDAQVLEQFSRSEESREANKEVVADVRRKLSNAQFQAGYGSMGGEEFFSYLNISESLERAGGQEWGQWNNDIKAKLVKLQNQDGSWAGHHCITGRVAVTSAAILTLTVDQT